MTGACIAIIVGTPASGGGGGGSITVSVSPYIVSKTRSGIGTITTPAATATPSGGTGPYTYAWSLMTGDTFTVDSPTASSTTFTAFLGDGLNKNAIYKVIVTDSAAATGTGYVLVGGYSTSTSSGTGNQL